MKHAHFFKNVVAVLLSSVLLLIVSACSQSSSVTSSAANSPSAESASSQMSVDVSSPPTSNPSDVGNQAGTKSSSDVYPGLKPSPDKLSPSPGKEPSGTDGDKSANSRPPYIDIDLSSPLSIYQPVLRNKAKFFSTDADKNLSLSQLNQAISSEKVTVDVTNFAVLDIGHGGAPAVILSINMNGVGYGTEVLSYQDGIVYGYTFSARQFGDLRADGTFMASSGAADVGICTITFDKKMYSIDEFTFSKSSTDSEGNMNVSYFVNHQSATKDKYDAAFSQWQKITYVTWYDFTDENIGTRLPDAASGDYQFAVNGNDTVTITKYTGKGGDVKIPAEIDGMKVIAIGNTFRDTGAFENCVALTSVVIPDGVTDIQDDAFYSCTSLKTATISASVTLLRNCAFADCPNLQSVYFKGNASQIANYVFDAPSLTFYYYEGAAGWTNSFYGYPTESY